MGKEKEDSWIGKRVGCYEVLEKTDQKDVSGHFKYRVKCIFCGNEYIARPTSVSEATSCPHYDKFGFPTFYGKDIKVGTLGRILRAMKNRCYNSKARDFRFYGGKGIKICDEWLYTPESFIFWAKENGYKDGLSIDRIDSSQNYCPENCRWVPMIENSRYKSTTNIITACGETHTGRQWSEILHVGANRINRIIRKKGKEAVIVFIEENYKKDSVQD